MGGANGPIFGNGSTNGGYGVTTTNAGKKNAEQIPQIDPSKALAYFYQAGQDEANGYAQGNTAYQAALVTAAQQIQTGYAQANSTLQPLASASQQALTLQQQMLGITPNNVAGIGSELSTYEGSDPVTGASSALSNLAGLISQAGSSSDVATRQALDTQITNQFASIGSSGVSAAQAAITSLGANPVTMISGGNGTLNGDGDTTPNLYLQSGLGQTQSGFDQQVNSNLTAGNAGVQGAYNSGQGSANSFYNASIPLIQQNDTNMNLYNNWNTTNTANQAALANAQSQQSQLNAFGTQFNQSYNPTAVGFTGQQATQQLESTPGYKFQVDQGDQQILRNQAAIGNLGTGNTQVALDTFGQNYAQNAYNGYMNNLQNVINEGIPATNQLAANQANQGGYLSNLTQLGGQSTQQADINQGLALGQAQNTMGNTSYNAAALNAQMQMQAFNDNMNASNQAMAAATNLAASAQNSSNNNSNANQQGAGFYQGMQAVQDNASTNTYSGSASSSVKSNGGDI